MTNDPLRHEIDALDADWDALSVSGGLVLPMNQSSRAIRQIFAADDAPAPSAGFVHRLESQLGAKQSVRPVQPSRRVNRQHKSVLSDEMRVQVAGNEPVRGNDRGWYSFLAVATVIVLIAGSLAIRQQFSGSDDDIGPAIPAAQIVGTPDSTPAQSRGASSADLGNTGSFADNGPSAFGNPIGVLPVGINGMSVTDAAIVIEYGNVLTAYDPTTLAQRWAVDLPYAIYSAPVVAGDAIYMSQTGQPGGSTEGLLGIDPMIDNMLVAFSLEDGSKIWSVDDAGAAPVPPTVVNGTVYCLGESKGNWAVYAVKGSDGTILWVSPALANQHKLGNSRPKIAPDTNTSLAVSDGLVAVSYFNGLHVFRTGTGKLAWSHIEDNDRIQISKPVISGGLIVSSFSAPYGPADDGSVTDGRDSIRAFYLKTGEQTWEKEFEAGEKTTAVATDGTHITWLTWMQTDTSVVNLHIASIDDGTEAGTIALEGANSVGSWAGGIIRLPDASPTMAGSMTYAIVGRGNSTSQIVAVETATGRVSSMTNLDGAVIVRPAMLNGMLYVASQVEGLLVLPASSETSPVGTAVATDLRTVNNCTAPETDNPVGSDAVADATPIAGLAGANATLLSSDVPMPNASTTPDQVTTEAILTRFDDYISCARAGDQSQLYNFFSTNYYANLIAGGMQGMLTGKDGEPRAPYFVDISTIQTLQPDSLVVLGDNRIGSIVTGNHAPLLVVWVLVDGEWRVDSANGIVDRDATPTS